MTAPIRPKRGRARPSAIMPGEFTQVLLEVPKCAALVHIAQADTFNHVISNYSPQRRNVEI